MAFCNKKKGKKGILTETVVALIVMAVTALILFGAVMIWKVQLENYVRRSTCAMSVVIKDKFNIWGYGDVFGYELKCDPILWTFKPDVNINEKAVDEMYDCWKTLGRGELDIISNFDWGKTDTACVICSSIKPNKDKMVLDMATFEKNLNSYIPEEGDKSFANYFNKKDEYLKIDYKDVPKIEVTKGNPLYFVYFFYKEPKEASIEQRLGIFSASEVAFVASKTGRRVLTFVAKSA